ncbi:helix-turn-helix domain-containing protein [Sporosarcina sp. 179-K 3D1 HS]|uniref:helix-turn-helix domain-containing protein n=1 Tax=Sporosarcina sp. 179-K 3D1 HS TaxID=3232169 RepID=UPI0039A1798E
MSDISNRYITLGKKIKERRKELKMTMTELANKTDLSQSAISMIENGLRQSTLQTINRISEALGYDFSQILVSNEPTSLEKKSEMPSQKQNGELTIKALQFNFSMQLMRNEPSLPDHELNELITATVLEEVQSILYEEHTRKRLEQRLSHVIKEEVERKKRELDQTLSILDI